MNNIEYKDIYITTPIFYVNDIPHIGHCYTMVIADCIARLYALYGKNVSIQTGTDEHGQKIAQSAALKNILPITLCNEITQHFYNLAVKINFCASYQDFNGLENFSRHSESLALLKSNKELLFHLGSNYIRTTNGRNEITGEITDESIAKGRHIKSAQAFWKKLEDNGWIYKGIYSGWYAVRDEAFYDESEIIDNHAPSGASVEWRKEESYFFRLSQFQNLLLKLYKDKDIVKPQDKKQEIISFISGLNAEEANKGNFKVEALKDLSVSRNKLDWGIPVPNNNSHKIYVWLDALVNYISAIGYPSEQCINYWKHTKTIHIIGKDILRFHAVYWPAFLISEQISLQEFNEQTKDKNFINKISYITPKEIFAHGWWTNKGEKISKSVGNVIEPSVEITKIQDDFGISIEEAVDYFRYILIKTMPVGNDGDYDSAKNNNIIESTICNNVGNFINRTLSMIRKDCCHETFFVSKQIRDSHDKSFVKTVNKNLCGGKIKDISKDHFKMIENYQISEIITAALEISSNCNKYIEEVKPWELRKEDIERFTVIMQILYTQIILLLKLLYFIMPTIISGIFDYLEISFENRCMKTDKSREIASNKIIEEYKPQNSQQFFNKTLPIFFKKTIKKTDSNNHRNPKSKLFLIKQ